MNTQTHAAITRKLGRIRQSAGYLANYANDCEEQQSAASISRLAREIENLLNSAPEPEPTAPASRDVFTIAGHEVEAPGFSPATFDQAIKRAHDDGIELEATDRGSVLVAVNPRRGSRYTVTRRSCTCKAGQTGIGCKHRAMAIFFADILGTTPGQLAEVA